MEIAIESIDHENYGNYNDVYDKNILLSIKKCCVIYTQYKRDKYIKKKFKVFSKLVGQVVRYLTKKSDNFIRSNESQNVDGVSMLIFMFSNLFKLHNILKIMNAYFNENKPRKPRIKNNTELKPPRNIAFQRTDEDEYDNKSSKVVTIMNTLIEKLKSNIDRSITRICTSYSLNPMQDNNRNFVEVNAILNSRVIRTDVQIQSRERTLISFCAWINQLCESLETNTLSEMSVFKDLQQWLNDKEKQWIEWLSGACLQELKTCNDLLIETSSNEKSWNNVEKLLAECESLRKVNAVSNNTSQEFFKTTAEFDFRKTELAKEAAELIDDFNKNDDANMNYEKIIKIANQLYNAGCSKESTEMKRIYNKLKQHLNNLKMTTEAIILSIETSDDLIVIQNAMTELDTLQTFATFMPSIKNDANECYNCMNDQILEVLNEIKLKYDLSKASTENSIILRDKLKVYSDIKNKIDENILNDVIMMCQLKSLSKLIAINEDKMDKLKNENASLEKVMEEKCGTVMKQIKQCEKQQKKGKLILMNDDSDDDDDEDGNMLTTFLNKIGFGSLKDIKSKLKQLKEKAKTICSKEQEQRDNNMKEINKLKRINTEIQKCAEAENSLMLLQPDKVVAYRTDNKFLANSISKLEKLLGKNQNYLFTQKLALYDAFHALTFLHKCKGIKWNLSNKMGDEYKQSNILSNKYVIEINGNVSKYLRAYGDLLESTLNDLIANLQVHDVPKCDLNNAEYVEFTQDVISKLNDCLREFREISNFDHQLKMQMEYAPGYSDKDKRHNRKQLKLVQCLFTNNDIQYNVDNYINSTISMHKQNILMNFAQWKVQRQEKLPVLRFICLSMSALDRFVSLNQNQNDNNTYYRIATQIDSALTKFGNDHTRKIQPLFENGLWGELKQTLDVLKKTADAHKHGIAQRDYRDAVMQLYASLNKLMNETKTKLLIDINKNNNIDDHKIISLKEGLDKVKNLVETIYPHLSNDSEKNKVKKEEKALGILLYDRLKQLMKAALQSAKKRDFRQCEKRLDNISRLMDYETQRYVEDYDRKKEEKTGNDDDEKSDDEYDNKIVKEYNKLKQQIEDELNTVLEEVDVANKLLSDTNGTFNPYYSLRLTSIHDHLARSQNEQFRRLWDTIYDDIVGTIQNKLNEIKQRNNQIQMQSELSELSECKSGDEMMTYSQQEAYLRRIEISVSLFPTEMKDIIQTMLKDTKDGAIGNKKIIDDGFKQYLDAKSWHDVARNLNEFQHSDPRLFQTSRKSVIQKINKIYTTFDKNMKTLQGFMDNIDRLDSYQSIGISFTNFHYYGQNNNNNRNNNNNITIPHIQSTLDRMYKDIENRFVNKCKDVKLSLNGKTAYTFLKDGFYVIIKVLEYKDKFPQMFAQNMMNEAVKLYKPIQKLINVLKTHKFRGLDKKSNDIDPLIGVLNDLKELNDVEFHSNVRKFIPFLDENKQIENVSKFEADIENIEYDLTVKETKDMLTEFKESISKEGLNKNIIQKNQAKRIGFLKEISMKVKSLTKSLVHICKQHLGMGQAEFSKTYIKPCTRRMGKDIKQMQNETTEAFNKQRLNTKDLQRANANLEAFYCIKNVFEKEINDEELCQEIQIDDAIGICQDTAIQKVQQLSAEIQIKDIDDDEKLDQHMEKIAENLINLEYLNQHINFKTSINENSYSMHSNQNEVARQIQYAIKKSMDHVTNNKKTKKKINVLYNLVTAIDAGYGTTFTQKHSAFKAAFAKTMNQKFRELKIDAIIENLQKTENEFKKQKLHTIGIDYDRLKEIFQTIIDKYEELIVKHLREAKSFEELKRDSILSIANDAKCIAAKAVNCKKSGLVASGMSYIKGGLSWFAGQNNSQSNSKSRDYYWTIEMRAAVPKLISHILAVWTLSNASCYYESDDKATLTKARNAQITAICCILCLDIGSQQKKLINNLVEVGTGEGKSVIMAVTAIVLALLDFDVYCACYSELLSKRDQNAFNDLFVQFNVHNHIQYSTFNNILEEMINDGGDIREITKNIVLSANINDDDHKTDFKQQLVHNRQKILFIDEVDKFFSTDFFGKQYTPSSVIPKAEMKNLILFVWNEYLNNECKGSAITIQKIEQSNQYAALLSSFNPEWHDLLVESVKDIIDGIRTFKDDSYKIENGRDICYKFSDTYSSKVFYGYRTLFTYLYELNNGNITNKEHVHDKLTWFLKCGSFSYSEIPNNFYAILGVTGTLKSLSKKEHQVIQYSYGIKKYIVMPSLFDKSGKLQYAQNRDINIIKREYFWNQLHATIQSYQVNDIETIERPIIVFFKDENMLNYFYNLQVCATWRAEDRIQLLTPDLSEIEKKNGILNTTKPNAITFATEEYGRGIDFKVFDKKLDMKGMHVELTYWPDTFAEEIQIKGRTARQGQKGSFHIILNENEITDLCKVSSKQIDNHKKNGDLYKWLSKIRDVVFEKQYDEASSYVKELKPIHKESEQLAASLRTKNIKIAKKQLLLFNKGANIQSAAKLSILIDSTGSMASCLNQCKTVIQKTIPQLVQFLANNNINTDSFEIQVIAYRNYNAPADCILEFCPFTCDESVLTTFIHSLKPTYGWGPEAVEIAFGQLNRQEKKPNIVMLMADAAAQTKKEIVFKRTSERGDKYWQDSRDGMFKNVLDWNEELNKFMNENNDAAFYCFYLSNLAKNNFNQIAQIGKGKSMKLNIDNEAKSVALLQSALSETILLKMNNNKMEFVEKFRRKHKNLPTFL